MKYRYQLTPVSVYDVRGVESWLEDMALRGLALVRLRPLFSTFEEGPARKTRYRAEPSPQKAHEDLPQDMLDLYQDFGWTLACVANDFLIFSTQDPSAPEPHSDPELQGQIWNKLYRRSRRNFIICLLLAIVATAADFSVLFQDGTPVLNLIKTSVLWTFVSLIIILGSLPQMWANVQQLSLIVRQLEAGIPLDHRIAYPRRRWSEAVASTVVVVLLAILLFSQLLPFTGGSVRPLDELTAFPLLSLESMEGEGYEPYSYAVDGQDYSNFCALDRYLLCPAQWQVVQTGDIEPDYWVRMEIWWYDLPAWLSRLSVPLAKELLNDAMGLNGTIWWTDEARNRIWTVNYYPQTDIDLLAVANNGQDGFQIAIAACGDKAVLVKYTGHGDLADYLDEITAMVQ